jgi:hypothetical protein
MTRSKLITGLLVTALTLALGAWSFVVVENRYQQSQSTGVTEVERARLLRLALKLRRGAAVGRSPADYYTRNDWPRIPGLPDVTTLQSSGWWEVFYAAEKNICGLTSYLAWETARGQIVVAKRSPTDDGLTVQLFKSREHPPMAPQVPMTIEFDQNPVWKVDGRAFYRHLFAADRDLSPGIEFTFTAKQSAEFMELFSANNAPWINFTYSTEPRWTIELRGSRDVVQGFKQCVKRYMWQ